MSVNRRTGFGHTLGCDAANGTSYTVLGAIVDGWKGPAGKKKTPNITLLSDTYEQFGVSQIDGGEVTFQILHDPDEATTTTLTTLFQQVTQVPANFQVSYGVGTAGSGTTKTETFHAHVTGLSKAVKVQDALMTEVTLKVTGAF